MSRRDERGNVTLLVIGFATVLAMAVAVVVDASAAYLHRSGLDTLADGAALHGADLGATGEDVYTGGVPEQQLAVTQRDHKRSYIMVPVHGLRLIPQRPKSGILYFFNSVQIIN